MAADSANRRSALIWRDRLRSALIVLAALGVMIIAIILIERSRPVHRGTVLDDVNSWSRAQTEIGAGSYFISVALEDGSNVTATAGRHGRAPNIGERITLTRIQSAAGGTRYEWVR